MAKTDPRALIVDDDHSWQQILSELLTDAGLVVDVADDLDEAIECLRINPHRLAVIDLSLGGSDHHNLDGLLVLDALRRHDPACRAMLLTGFATVELAVRALTEYGAFTCLRKENFLRSHFRDLVSRAMASAPLPITVIQNPGESSGHPGSSTPDASPTKSDPGTDQVNLKRLALVVEDDAGWQGILSELLISAGYRVHRCSGYGEGLGRLRREKYNLAVIDLSLTGSAAAASSSWEENSPEQGLDGYRLLASTRAGVIPTIVVSGVATPADIERTYARYGIYAFLQKQVFSRQVFLQSVDEALRTGGGSSELDALTDREREVLGRLAQGLTNKEIAEELVISSNTVKRHLKAIFEKLEIHTRSAAAAKAVGGAPDE